MPSFGSIMAHQCSLRPLHSIPDLIPACIKILKDEWPQCKAELLPKLAKQELNTAPCSYGLVQHPDDPRDKDTLLCHVRLIPVLNRRRALYSESFCLAKTHRGRGLGRIAILKLEEMLARNGFSEIYVATYPGNQKYLKSFTILDKPVCTLGANLLQTKLAVGANPYSSWYGNLPYPGWESEYDGRAVATEKEVTDKNLFVWCVRRVIV